MNRKHQLGPLRRALTKYKAFLGERPTIVAGDFNNIGPVGASITPMPSRPEKLGLASAYHALRGEPQGAETVPTLYWRDRKKDGPAYHIDYIFLPAPWLGRVRELAIGTFEDWCGSGLSDHVPMVVDIML